MKWIRVRAGGSQEEYVDLDKVLNIQFLTQPNGVKVARLRVAGGGEKLITAGEVDDPALLAGLRQMKGIREGPAWVPTSVVGEARAA